MTTTLTLTINDVRKNATIAAAIEAQCQDHATIASESDACERYDIEIHGDGITYYDAGTCLWYAGERSDLIELRALMSSKDKEIARSAYSHWCAGGNSHDEYETQEEAIAAAEAL